MKIAEELSSVRMLSPRDEGIVQANLGRLQGLGQGMDFLIEQYNPDGLSHTKQVIGFNLNSNNPEQLDLEDEEDPEEDTTKVPKQS